MSEAVQNEKKRKHRKEKKERKEKDKKEKKEKKHKVSSGEGVDVQFNESLTPFLGIFSENCLYYLNSSKKENSNLLCLGE